MRALSKKEFTEVMDFVQQWHEFADVSKDRSKYPKMEKYGMSIKYIDSTYDNRTQEIFCLTFRSMGEETVLTTTNIFDGDIRKNYESLYDYAMDYLKGEIKFC